MKNRNEVSINNIIYKSYAEAKRRGVSNKDIRISKIERNKARHEKEISDAKIRKEYRRKRDIKDLATIRRVNKKMKFFIDFEFSTRMELMRHEYQRWTDRFLYYKTSHGLLRISIDRIIDGDGSGHYDNTDDFKQIEIIRLIERYSKK